MFSYEKLEIWQLAIEYAKDVYRITRSFPNYELYGLVSQLQRAVISISANIAEGSGSSSTKDQINFLDIAIKSTLETASEIQIALELNYFDQKTRDRLHEQAEKIVRKIRSFKIFLKNDTRSTIHD